VNPTYQSLGFGLSSGFGTSFIVTVFSLTGRLGGISLSEISVSVLQEPELFKKSMNDDLCVFQES
jgi:hypothetical protein